MDYEAILLELGEWLKIASLEESSRLCDNEDEIRFLRYKFNAKSKLKTFKDNPTKMNQLREQYSKRIECDKEECILHHGHCRAYIQVAKQINELIKKHSKD